MENVLIVDDDEGFLLSLTDMFKSSEQKFSIHTANNGKQALNILQEKPINLVVTDLKMPELDGFDLLANINNNHPDIPVIIMTAYGTPEMENRLKDMGAFQYIEKPIDFNVLQHKVQDGLAACSKGHIDGISLASFMQLLQLDKKTCTLTVTSKKKIGNLYFQNGELTNAKTGSLNGLDAAMEVSSWDNARIEIINICKNQEKLIEVPLGFILIESARLKDERAKTTPRNKKGQDSFNIPGVNLDELDFDASRDVGAISEEELIKSVEKTDSATAKSPLPIPKKTKTGSVGGVEVIKQTIASFNDILKMIIVAKDGKVLALNNCEVKKFGNFIAYVSSASEHMGTALGFSKPRHALLTQESGGDILVMKGSDITIGLEIGQESSPNEIATILQPLILKAKTR